MQRCLKEMKGYTVEAADGDIGKVSGFLFDDKNWRVRYLVVDVGNWLSHKQVLISPVAIKEPRELRVSLDITKDRVANSPSIDTRQPVSREKEKELHSYYGWPLYWEGALETGMAPYPAAPQVNEITERNSHKGEEEKQNGKSNHLRSTNEIAGYSIHAKDGDIGHIDDFIVSTDIWRIQYIVVDTKKIFAGKKVILPSDWTTDISWEQTSLSIEVKREEVENSPEFDPSKPVNRETEEILYDYYGRPKYWTRDL